jgi:hypothetical protein
MGPFPAQNPDDLFYHRRNRNDHSSLDEETVSDSGAGFTELFLFGNPIGCHQLEPLCDLVNCRTDNLFFIWPQVQQTIPFDKS